MSCVVASIVILLINPFLKSSLGLNVRYESGHEIEKARGGEMPTNQVIFLKLGIALLSSLKYFILTIRVASSTLSSSSFAASNHVINCVKSKTVRIFKMKYFL